jgi:hypothetical protein
VLDEIQRHLVVINDKNDNLFYVYEMPEEWLNWGYGVIN